MTVRVAWEHGKPTAGPAGKAGPDHSEAKCLIMGNVIRTEKTGPSARRMARRQALLPCGSGAGVRGSVSRP